MRDAWMQLCLTGVVPCLDMSAGASPIGASCSCFGWHYDGALANSTTGWPLLSVPHQHRLGAGVRARARGLPAVVQGCTQ